MSARLQEKHSGLLASVNLGQALPLEGGLPFVQSSSVQIGYPAREPDSQHPV